MAPTIWPEDFTTSTNACLEAQMKTSLVDDDVYKLPEWASYTTAAKLCELPKDMSYTT